jgi:hypothetical protein
MELINYVTKANYNLIKSQDGKSICLHFYPDCLRLNSDYRRIPNSGTQILKFNSTEERKIFFRERKCQWFFCDICNEKTNSDLDMKNIQGKELSPIEINAQIIPLAYKNWLEMRNEIEIFAKAISHEEYVKEKEITENEKKEWHKDIGESILLQL